MIEQLSLYLNAIFLAVIMWLLYDRQQLKKELHYYREDDRLRDERIVHMI